MCLRGIVWMRLCPNMRRVFLQNTRIGGWSCSFALSRKGRARYKTGGPESLFVCSYFSLKWGMWCMYPSINLDCVYILDRGVESIVCSCLLPRMYLYHVGASAT